jgi:hypothetical protein
VLEQYVGHREYQDPAAGVVSWGVAPIGNGDAQPSAKFGLVWLEIF